MPLDSTVRDLDDLIVASRAVKRPFEPDAFLNVSFFVGQQWVSYDGTRLWEPKLEDWREKVTDNRIQPAVRTEIAKMTKTRPTFTCLPGTPEDQDIADARYGELVLEDAWERHDLQRKLRTALLWSRVAMAGFWKIWWDAADGEKRDLMIWTGDHPQAGAPVTDRYGAPVTADQVDALKLPDEVTSLMESRTVGSGEVCVEPRTFFETHVDPHAGEEGLGSAEWAGEEVVQTREYMRRHFPEVADELVYDASPSPGTTEMRTSFGMSTDPAVPQSQKGVKVREVWTRDEHAIWLEGKEVLVHESNDYGWIPYVDFRGVPAPGRFWPDCVVTQLRPRQVDLNKRLSQISENAERIGNPPLMVPNSMGEDFRWSGLSGEIIYFMDTGSPNAMPQFMAIPGLPAYIENDVQRIEQSMMEISGQHEVTGAQVPTGVTAASAINLLQEADDTRLGPDIADMERALADAGQRILDLVSKYYDERKMIQIAGKDGTWDVQAFRTDGLKGAKEVRVQAGSAMPQTKAAKQAAIQQLATLFIQNQQQISPRAWAKILNEFDVGGIQEFFASEARDERQISEENRLMAAGNELTINSYDNDPSHIEGHQDFQKTSRYSDLPPPVKQIFEQHVAMHKQRAASAQTAPLPPAGQAPPPGANGANPLASLLGGQAPPPVAS